MKITVNLVRFAIVITILTVVFRCCLSYGVEQQSVAIITVAAVLYGIGMFASGWYFGFKDGEYLPIFDVGFRFHLTTYTVFNVLSELWFLLGFNSNFESVRVMHRTAIIWGVFLVFHFIFYLWSRKHTINHLSKDDLFE